MEKREIPKLGPYDISGTLGTNFDRCCDGVKIRIELLMDRLQEDMVLLQNISDTVDTMRQAVVNNRFGKRKGPKSYGQKPKT